MNSVKNRKLARVIFLLAFGAVFLFLPLIIYAADPPQGAAPSSAMPPQSSSGNVTIDFKDANIQDVLRILSLKSGVNIITGNDVSGTVTVRLVDVPWEKALDVILKTYGYTYDRDGSIIRVTTIENLSKEELSTEVFTLNYAQAEEIEKALKDVLSERGKVRFDSRSNTLIVTDTSTNLQNVKTIVERLDKTTPQVSIHAKVIETSLGDTDLMGVKWDIRGLTLSGSARPVTFPFDARDSGDIGEAGNRYANNSDWNNFFPLPAGNKGYNTPDYTYGPLSFPTTSTGFTFGTLSFSQFKMVLDLVQSRTDSKTLSEPHIMTLNNKEASILVGEILAIPTFERNSSTGAMEITGYTDRDVGIKLKVLPQINSANEIVVDVNPEITELEGYDSLTGDIKAPRFSSRNAKTQVRINDGDTIVVGGLIKETKSKTTTKVPFMGDLPLLGKAFTHNDETSARRNLLFFMTVNVVPDKKEKQAKEMAADTEAAKATVVLSGNEKIRTKA